MNGGDPGPAREGWRRDITGLRGLSVVLVVAYHLQLRGAGGGFIGVDVFFVISGYLMTRIVWGALERGDFGYWRFVGARIARIWPALGAMLLMLMVLGLWLLPPFDLAILAHQSLYAVLFWSNQFFLQRTGYNTQSIDTQWLLHTWSLSVEWQFYLLYPLLLWGVARWTSTRRAALLAVAAVLLASLACHALLSASRPDSAFFLLPARAWELLAGGVVFLLAPLGGPRLRRVAAWAGVGLIVVAALGLALRRVPAVGSGAWLVLPVLGAALVLWARDADNPLLRQRALQALGRWSYSIYLWHWPLIVGLGMTDAFLDHPRLSAVGVALLSVLCGSLSYRWVESMSVSGDTWRRLRKPSLAMGGAAVLAVGLWAAGGLPSRQGEGGAPFEAYQASVRAAYYPDRCSNFMKRAVDTQVCAVAKGSRRRILVIGDSHAEQLYPWFVAHSEVSADFFTQAECPPVPGFERTQAGFHCRDYAQAAWQKAASADYDTLVLAAYWPNIGLDGAPYCHVGAAGTACRLVRGDEKQALVRSELQAAIAALVAQGKTVVMLAPTPEARVRVPERIERERFWYGQTRLVIDERTIAQKTGWLEPLWRELRSLPGFHLVSVNDRLCADGVCKVYDAELKRPVYIDETHFDPLWMARHGGVLAPFAQDRR